MLVLVGIKCSWHRVKPNHSSPLPHLKDSLSLLRSSPQGVASAMEKCVAMIRSQKILHIEKCSKEVLHSVEILDYEQAFSHTKGVLKNEQNKAMTWIHGTSN